MSSVRNRDATDEPDDDGMKIRGKPCENGETDVKAYGKFEPSGISGEHVISIVALNLC